MLDRWHELHGFLKFHIIESTVQQLVHTLSLCVLAHFRSDATAPCSCYRAASGARSRPSISGRCASCSSHGWCERVTKHIVLHFAPDVMTNRPWGWAGPADWSGLHTQRCQVLAAAAWLLLQVAPRVTTSCDCLRWAGPVHNGRHFHVCAVLCCAVLPVTGCPMC
jgi:hypothetical protein